MMIITKEMQDNFITEHFPPPQACGGLPQGWAVLLGAGWH